MYCLSTSLPEVVSQLTEKRQLQIQEVRREPGKRRYTVLQFRDIAIDLEYKMVQGLCT
jgi:hypothetical protein